MSARGSSYLSPRLAFVALLLTLTGCTVAPGIQMEEGSDSRFATEQAEDPSRFDVEIQEINAEVIANQQEQVRPIFELSGKPRTREEITADYEYRVGVGDVLAIIVWGHPELTNPFGTGATTDLEDLGRVVREDGTIFFPHLGLVEVEGKTIEQIRSRMAEQLKPYLADPQIAVRVVSFQSKRAYITGQVKEPGIVRLRNSPTTVMDAVNAAGGFTEEANRRRAMLTRGDEQIPIDLLNLYATGNKDFLLRHNDVLHIPDNRSNRVFIVGEVSEQTTVPLHNGQLTLAEAITEAEGLDLSLANTAEIYVIRGTPVPDPEHQGELLGIRPDVYQLDARKAPALVLADGFELQPRDVVFVAATPVVQFNRVISQYVPIVQALWQTDRILTD